MKLTALAFTFAVAAATVQAAAVPGKTIAIPLSRVASTTPKKHRMGASLKKLASKYGGKVGAAHANAKAPTTSTTAATTAGTGGDENVTNVGNEEFFGAVTVGGQPINMLFDTGSADVWVPSNTCGQACPGTQQFDPTKSATAADIGAPFNIQYGSGSATGTTFSDTIELAGVSVQTQTLGLVTSEGQNPQPSDFDGIMGFSFSTIAADGAPTFFENAVSQGSVQKSQFSFFLSSTPGVSSELLLGGTDASHFTGDIAFVPVDKPGFWQFGLSDVTFNGASTNPTLNEAIADTGTSLIVGPSADITAVNNAIGATLNQAEGVFTIDCSKQNAQDKITFQLAGTALELTANEYIISDGTGGCISTFAALDGAPGWILGDTLLRKYYSVYDLGNPQAGFSGAQVGFALASPADPGN
ncbi:hypothetical protein HKX48_008351 [Thoreauomyces humboldtii]|nr:hypothetical protein HKX48_008351 [Thoreauomyces humboldtii]